MKTHKSKKLLALLIALITVLSSMPFLSVSADDSDYGVVEALTGTAANTVVDKSEPENVKVTFSDTISLNWVAADSDAGRNMDGWWVGVKVTAPQGMAVDKVNEVKYDRLQFGVSPVKNLSFGEYKDSEDDDSQQYITLWSYISTEGINYAKSIGKDSITDSWVFHWKEGVDQTVTVSTPIEKVVLKKDGDKVYPLAYMPEIESISKPATIDKSVSTYVTVEYGELSLDWAPENKEIKRIGDAWWVGLKITANEALGNKKSDPIGSSKYWTYDPYNKKWSDKKSFWDVKDSKDNAEKVYVEYWFPLTKEIVSGGETYTWQILFDWDNDNTYDQYVNAVVDTSKVTLECFDTAAPDITAAISKESWTNETPTISGTIVDPLVDGEASGLASAWCEYKKDGETETVDITVDSDGKYAFEVPLKDVEGATDYTICAKDRIGNPSSKQVTAMLDLNAPAINIDAATFDAANGWKGKEVTLDITGTVTDAFSGVKEVTWEVNGQTGKATVQGNEFSFSIPTEGYETFTGNVNITAEDNVGNKMTDSSIYVMLDADKPSFVTYTDETNDKIGKWTNEFTVCGTCNDAHSGVKEVLYKQAGDTQYKPAKLGTDDNGNTTFEFSVEVVNGKYNGKYSIKIVDAVGNENELEDIDVKLETIAPVISAAINNDNKDLISADFDGKTFYNDVLAPSFEITDEDSGVSKVSFNISVNGEAVEKELTLDASAEKVSYSFNSVNGELTQTVGGASEAVTGFPSIAVSDNNEIVIKVSAADLAGNKMAEHSYTYYIDNKAPALSNDNLDVVTNDDVDVVISLGGEAHFDKDSDVCTAAVSYSKNGVDIDNADVKDSFDNGVVRLTLTEDGKYIVNSAVVTDALGNTSESLAIDDVKAVIDKYTPVLESATVTSASPIRLLRYGIFAKSALELEVVIADLPEGIDKLDYTSGIDKDNVKLKLSYKDKNKVFVATELKKDEVNQKWVASFVIPEDATTKPDSEGAVSVTVTDNASNGFKELAVIRKDGSVVKVNEDEVDVNNTANYFLIETGNPEINITTETSAERLNSAVFGDKTFYNSALVPSFEVTDSEANGVSPSGINSVTVNIEINGNSKEVTFDTSKEQITKATYAYDIVKGELTQTIGETSTSKTGLPKIEKLDVNEIKITVNAQDNAFNDAKAETFTYYVDNKAPEVKSITSDNSSRYTNKNVTFTYDISDEQHFDKDKTAATLEYMYNGGAEKATLNDAISYAGGELTNTFKADGQYEPDKLTVVDALGNKAKPVSVPDSDNMRKFTIDKRAPKVKEIEITNAEGLTESLRLLKYGIFTNKVVKITATVANSCPDKIYSYTSPIVKDGDNAPKISISYGEKIRNIDGAIAPVKNKDNEITGWTITFEVPLKSVGLMTMSLGDEAGNLVENLAVKNNDDDNLKVVIDKDVVNTSFILTEKSSPAIEITRDAQEIADATSNERLKYIVDDNGMPCYNDDVIIPVSVSDGESDDENVSGLYSVLITVNDKEYLSEGYENFYKNSDDYIANKVTSKDYTIDTSKCKLDKDGCYNITVKVVDFAGNEKTDSFTVYKDTETAYVTDFSFNHKDYQEKSPVELVKLKNGVYAYYFKSDTKVTITAVDKNNGSEPVGVKSITCYALDINGKFAVSETKKVNANDKASFVIPANFKGQLYAYATDKLGNNYSTALICDEKLLSANPTDDDTVKCITPDKTIVESASKHKSEEHIKYEIIDKATLEDASGLPLYSDSVRVKVTITDTYSGIRSGSVVVNSSESNVRTDDTSFEITKNTGYKKGSTINGWTVEDMDGNLVTKICKIITVTRNSNRIVLTTSMMDRAGNQTSNVKSPKFSIDTVSPEITVRYNNNSADSAKYFKEARTATITVKERNFDPERVVVTKNGKQIKLSWSDKSYKNNSNLEGKTYTAKIDYSADGDYTFDITCTDRANNKEKNLKNKYAGQVAPKEFTIDKTAPVVTVTNESTARPQNTNYYSQPVKVTINVNEHNWAPDRFKITYLENDKVVTKALSWSNSGDTHTASFVCDSVTGLNYKIDYELKDKAGNDCLFVVDGNKVKDYKQDDFYVDQTKPTIEFTGIINGSHNNGPVESGVDLEDTYYDRVEVTITGKRRQIVETNTYTSKTVNIQEFINETRDKDDFYTISVVAYDKAGNHNEPAETISYSINRNGSMFVISEKSMKLMTNGSQSSIDDDVVIYEYNVDRTVENTVEIFKDGNIIKLNSSDDYIISSDESLNGSGYCGNTYTISKSVFADDAEYKIYITTKDEAGNTSTNISDKNSGAFLTNADGKTEAPILSFIKDATKPTIKINLDKSKADPGLFSYQIAKNNYTVEFTPVDNGSGIDPETIAVLCKVGKEEKSVDFEEKDGVYTFTLKRGTYRDLKFTFKDNAGNDFETLVFKKITVSSNAFERFVNNTALLVGVIIAIVALAIIIILLIAKRRKNDDDEEDGTYQPMANDKKSKKK